MDNGVSFKYTHFKELPTDIKPKMSCTDIEVPCSHPSAICVSRLTTPHRRAKTAALRRHYKSSRSSSSQHAGHSASHTVSVSASTCTLPNLQDHTTQLNGCLSARVLPRSRTFGNLVQINTETKEKLRLEDFIQRAPSGMAIRPKMVFQCKLQPVELPEKVTPPSYQKTFFQTNKKKPRFHFIHPDWFSEKQMYHRLVKDGQKDRVEYGWI